MKNIFTLIVSSLTFFNVHCQTIKDTLFNEVYIIKTENIIKNDNALFIDIAIETQKTPVVLMSSDRNVSAKLFCDRRIFLPEQNKFILITPDWEFIKKIREREKREGIHIKAEKHKFYYIERNITDCKIDSLSRSIHDVRNPITLNYKEVKNVISEKSIKKIRGFILDNAEYTKTKVPIVEAVIEVKATERKTYTDQDGKFEIEAIEGDTLIVSGFGIKTVEILITKKECYKVDLNSNMYEPLMGGKHGRKYKRQQRKIERSMELKIKNGFYDCPIE